MFDLECSVVVPTAGDAPRLERVVDALLTQDVGHDRYEIVVVDNNRVEESTQQLYETLGSRPIRVIREATPGAAAARNGGARVARGELLVFVDDDIAVSGDFLLAHLRAHDRSDPVVGVGAIVERNARGGWFLDYLRDRGVVNRVEDPERLSFRNVYGANLSIRRDVFDEVGGFDEQFRRREDEELGWRLMQRGIEPVLAADAVGEHHSTFGPAALIRRSYWNGYYLAMLVEKHPELAQRERLELYRPWVRYASYVAGPILCAVGAVVASLDPRLLHRGITALVLARSSSGFAAFRRRHRDLGVSFRSG